MIIVYMYNSDKTGKEYWRYDGFFHCMEFIDSYDLDLIGGSCVCYFIICVINNKCTLHHALDPFIHLIHRIELCVNYCLFAMFAPGPRKYSLLYRETQ